MGFSNYGMVNMCIKVNWPEVVQGLHAESYNENPLHYNRIADVYV